MLVLLFFSCSPQPILQAEDEEDASLHAKEVHIMDSSTSFGYGEA